MKLRCIITSPLPTLLLVILMLTGCIENSLESIENNKLKVDDAPQAEDVKHQLIALNCACDGFSDFNVGAVDDMRYVGDDAFAILLEIHQNYEFSGQFQDAEANMRKFYLEQFYGLARGNVSFIIRNINFCLSLGETSFLLGDNGRHYADFSNAESFLFFDMNKDGSPDLVVVADNYYIFKYVADDDEIILWNVIDRRYNIIGSLEAMWFSGTTRSVSLFYILGSDGVVTTTIFSFVDAGRFDPVFIAALPVSTLSSMTTEAKASLLDYAYIGNYGNLYFRITEVQYDLIFGEFWNAVEVSMANRDEVTFTFAELFEDFN